MQKKKEQMSFNDINQLNWHFDREISIIFLKKRKNLFFCTLRGKVDTKRVFESSVSLNKKGQKFSRKNSESSDRS